MPDGPSPGLERIVGAVIPPACREEVLGDLREKYISPFQYVRLAISVVPFVILSRIRRTSDLQMRMTEALLIYACFLAAAWYNERAVLTTQQGLFRVAIPTAVNLLDLFFEDAWAGGSKWVLWLVRGLALGIGIDFNVYGEFASVLLVLGLRWLTGSGRGLAHAAAIPPGPRTAPVAAHGTAGNLLIAAGAVALAALFLALAGRPAGRAALGVIAAFVVVILVRGPRKE